MRTESDGGIEGLRRIIVVTHIAAVGSADQLSTLISLLRWRAERQPDQVAYRFLRDGERDEVMLSYAELDHQARVIAARLRELGAFGERVILLYPPGLDYITAFFGCLYAGAVAVPMYPPDPARLERSASRLAAIAGDAEPLATLTTSAIAPGISALTQIQAGSMLPEIVPTDEIPRELASGWKPPAVDADSAAFLQYTSGSTATPRGVLLSHGNLMHNSGLIYRVFGHSPETRAVAWLPPYHDMGLIGGIIQPLYGAFPVTLMSATDFLRRPLRWLKAMSSFRATISGGPNFAYDLCVRKICAEDRAKLDLSSWRVAFNGAEPVRAETLERFAAAFEPSGFRREAFYPCYGLAEATLMVTGGVPWSAAATGAPGAATMGQPNGPDGGEAAAAGRLVSCGRPAGDQRIVIADAATRKQCAPGQVGEIWVAGPSVAQSYWSRPELSQEVFQARLADTGEGPFLRTGDLGFIRREELFVAGRLKDLIVVRGRNHYPQDIEWTAERSHPALRPGCGAAFAVPEDGQERLVLAWELSPRSGDVDGDEVARAVRSAVAREHDLQVGTVVLLPPGGIQKTSSGKIQRRLCAALYGSGKLGGRVVSLTGEGSGEDGHSADQGSASPGAGPAAGECRARLLAAPPARRPAILEEYLCSQIAAACGVTSGEVDPRQPLLALGADSLAVIALQQTVEQDLSVALSVSELTEASVSSIARRLDEKTTAASDSVRPGPDATISEATLSHGQRALWFMQELTPGSSEHNIAAALRLRGELDVAALREALNGLVARHAVLRTTFGSRAGEPVARIAATGAAYLREHDVVGVRANSELVRRLSDAASEPFDLASGPLLRVDLYHTAPGEAVLLAGAHHIIMDFWSMSTLIGELETLYTAARTASYSAPVAFPPQVASYYDVVAWQESTLTGDSGRALRAYWADELRGATGELDLVRQQECPVPGQSASAGTCRVRIGRALLRRVKERARAEGVTVYMVLLAAFQLLLHRYTGQEDLVVGTPTAGRGRPEFERVVGYCMNPVAVRSQLAGGESVRDVLAQVRRRVLGALDHHTLPLHLLPSDRQAGSPLFRALFVVNRPPVRGAGELALLAMGEPGLQRPFADLLAEPVELQQHEAAVDLHLAMAEIDDMLFGSFRYRTGLLDDDGAHQMMRHFENILTAVAEDAGQAAATVAMLDGQERHRILTGWNATRDGHESGVTLAGLIERQAAATPDAVAVVGEDGVLSYRELNERANGVAHLLAVRGVGPGARVGLCLDRSPNMIVALLAALKSGAAYVPADPAHPHDRTSAMFADSGVTVIVSQRQLTHRLPEGIDTILLDEGEGILRERRGNPGLAVADGSPAYVMYTSGSTGTPKGVVVSHRSLANYVRFAAEDFAMSAGDRVLQFASLSFDTSAQEIYTALITGATLVLRNDRMLSSPRAFMSACAQWSVTVLDLPTAYWHELVVGITETNTAWPATLRLMVIGGERAVPDLVRAWQRQVGDRIRLINDYGPTEATIVAITRDLTGDVGPGEVPIGTSVAGATAYVLDEMRQPLPAGVVGELYLGGVGLAYGYLDRPALTAQSFVPHPFEAGSRLYRTGDLASFTPDGELVFRGRADRQVKLRGYRIEPAEIESALRELPGVADALVVLRGEPRQLVGYLVSAGAVAPRTVALRAGVRGKLPEYMVPSVFITVPSFPLNHNGKVDVAALPAPQAPGPEGPEGPEAPEGPEGRTAPRTAAERFMTETFAEVLGLPAVGVDDDFFGRGGHSLLATKVIARIQDHFRVDIPLRAIFEAPTPAELAEVLAQAPQGSHEPQPPIRSAPRDQPLPLSYVQEGIWSLQMLAPESTTYNVPRALRIRGNLSTEVVAEAFAALERRHEILRTTFPDIDGEPVQVIHPPRGIPVAIIDLRDRPEAERDDRIQELILKAGQTVFDLAKGPLLRVTLVQLGPSDHVLIVVEHHLVHDGWAQGVFLRDFLELYRALDSGDQPRLPELTVQYADYAYSQRQVLSSKVLDEMVDFWARELSGAPQLLPLPTDWPRPPTLTFAGGQENLVIDGEIGAALRQFSHDHHATLFMMMFSAFATLLNRYSGQEDILVGVGIANRQRPEVENLLGMMINTVPLRARMSGDQPFTALLERVRETCLRIYAHQDMPFGKLVEALRPKRSLGHMPLCQVMFTFLDTPMPKLELPGLSFEVIEVHNKTAKFDLNVVVQPHAEQRPGAPSAKTDGRITVYMEYNADVFDAATARQMLDDFNAILVAAVGAPQQPLDRFLEGLGQPRDGRPAPAAELAVPGRGHPAASASR
jgi:amino acid adenylation domain-containing protein